MDKFSIGTSLKLDQDVGGNDDGESRYCDLIEQFSNPYSQSSLFTEITNVVVNNTSAFYCDLCQLLLPLCCSDGDLNGGDQFFVCLFSLLTLQSFSIDNDYLNLLTNGGEGGGEESEILVIEKEMLEFSFPSFHEICLLNENGIGQLIMFEVDELKDESSCSCYRFSLFIPNPSSYPLPTILSSNDSKNSQIRNSVQLFPFIVPFSFNSSESFSLFQIDEICSHLPLQLFLDVNYHLQDLISASPDIPILSEVSQFLIERLTTNGSFEEEEMENDDPMINKINLHSKPKYDELINHINKVLRRSIRKKGESVERLDEFISKFTCESEEKKKTSHSNNKRGGRRNQQDRRGGRGNHQVSLWESFPSTNSRFDPSKGFMPDLPILDHEDEFIENFAHSPSRASIVCGETGSGKSTQIPKFILKYFSSQLSSSSSSEEEDENSLFNGRIVVCQPR